MLEYVRINYIQDYLDWVESQMDLSNIFIISNSKLGIWLCSQPRIDVNSHSNFNDIIIIYYTIICPELCLLWILANIKKIILVTHSTSSYFTGWRENDFICWIIWSCVKDKSIWISNCDILVNKFWHIHTKDTVSHWFNHLYSHISF